MSWYLWACLFFNRQMKLLKYDAIWATGLWKRIFFIDGSGHESSAILRFVSKLLNTLMRLAACHDHKSGRLTCVPLSLSLHSLPQVSVLLAESFAVSPVLFREQPAGRVLRGAPQLQLSIPTHPLPAPSALRRRRRIRLRRVRSGQPHPMRGLQPRLRPRTGRL